METIPDGFLCSSEVGYSKCSVCVCSCHKEKGCHRLGKAKSTLSLGCELPSTNCLVQSTDSCLGVPGLLAPPGPRNTGAEGQTAVCVGLQLYLHTKVQYELGLLHLRGGIIQSTPTTVDSLSEGVHTFVSTYTHVVLTSMFSHDSACLAME